MQRIPITLPDGRRFELTILPGDSRLSVRWRARILAGCYAIPTRARLRSTTA